MIMKTLELHRGLAVRTDHSPLRTHLLMIHHLVEQAGVVTAICYVLARKANTPCKLACHIVLAFQDQASLTTWLRTLLKAILAELANNVTCRATRETSMKIL